MPKNLEKSRSVKISLDDADLKVLRDAASALALHCKDGTPIKSARFLALRLWDISYSSTPDQSDAALRRSAAARAYQLRRDLNPRTSAKTVRYEVSILTGFSEKTIEVIVAKERNNLNHFRDFVNKQAADITDKRELLEEILRDNDKVFT